jgi:hypothetical protein
MLHEDRAGGVPPLSRAILSHIAHGWQEIAEVRAAARALSQKSRFAKMLCIAVNEVRVALAAALLCTEPWAASGFATREDAKAPCRSDAVRRALRLYLHARAVITDCAEPLATEWRLLESQLGKVLQAFKSVVGGDGQSSCTSAAPVPTSPPRPKVELYAQSIHLFLAAIAQGMPSLAVMEAFGTLGKGSFSHDDKSFFPENESLGTIADSIGHFSRRLVVSGCKGEGDTTIFLVSGAVAAIASDRALQTPWADRSRCKKGCLETLPDFISLQRDEEGRPIIQQSWSTAFVEARDAWASELGSLDAVMLSITLGQLVMLRVSALLQQKTLLNHPSWETDKEAKQTLCTVIMTWLASGVLEYVAWDDKMPILLQ